MALEAGGPPGAAPRSPQPPRPRHRWVYRPIIPVTPGSRCPRHPRYPGRGAPRCHGRRAPSSPRSWAIAPDGPDWLHEIKFDGFRILARLERGRARLLSRNGKDWTARFADVAAAVARFSAHEAVLDGEVAAVLPNGTTSFQALQNVFAGQNRTTVVYYVFDLLFAEGHDLTRVPLESRKEALRRLLGSAGDPFRYSDHVVGSGPEVYSRSRW